VVRAKTIAVGVGRLMLTATAGLSSPIAADPESPIATFERCWQGMACTPIAEARDPSRQYQHPEWVPPGGMNPKDFTFPDSETGRRRVSEEKAYEWLSIWGGELKACFTSRKAKSVAVLILNDKRPWNADPVVVIHSQNDDTMATAWCVAEYFENRNSYLLLNRWTSVFELSRDGVGWPCVPRAGCLTATSTTH